MSNLCPTTPCLKCVSIRSLRPVECASVAIPLSNSCPTWSNSYKVPRSCVQLMSNYTMSKRCVYSKSKACRMRTGGHTVGQLVSKLYPTAPMICKWRVYPSLRGAQLFIITPQTRNAILWVTSNNVNWTSLSKRCPVEVQRTSNPGMSNRCLRPPSVFRHHS